MRTALDVVRAICRSLPEAEEGTSHGKPSFKVRGKGFATYTVDHHGDGRVALWLRAPPGAQEHWTRAEPATCFVPPYVGPRGWLGVDLGGGLDWSTVARLLHDAYAHVAPRALGDALGPVPAVEPPSLIIDPDELDPWRRAPDRAVLRRLGELCLALPETAQGERFGAPSWRAGKKVFCTAHHWRGRPSVSTWVGFELQSLLTDDPRYRVPAYTGKNGWIALDVAEHVDWQEVEVRVLESYRHFALKRMLAALDEA